MTSTFGGLDLIDSVPEELWTEVCNIIQEVVIKTIPKKKKGKKAKQLPEDALQTEKKRNDRQSRKGKIYPFECSSEEEQGEIRKPS